MGTTGEINQFETEIIQGLLSSPKYLPTKYFYDSVGDELFKDLMNCQDYYLARCEMEIFTKQTAQLVNLIKNIGNGDKFNLIELGAGDASKSIHLLKGLVKEGLDFVYVPIDISQYTINYLQTTLSTLLPTLKFSGMCGEYFDMLERAANSRDPKVILFLGSTIGSMVPKEAGEFFSKIRSFISPGDILIAGFDLKKHPEIIRTAYNDGEGIEKRFNLNLLTRINKEMGADFDTSQFDHYCTYDPEMGAIKSYLISLQDVEVHIGNSTIFFKKHEHIWMMMAQKYTLDQINKLGEESGFKSTMKFLDEKQWFTDVVWTAC